MGKTAWAINIAQRVATYSGHSVGIFSLEMSKEALLRRMLASQSMVGLGSILTGKMPANERENLLGALAQLVEAKLFIDDTAAISLAELRSKATRLKNSTDGLDLIVVDYLQLMTATAPGSRQRYENRTQEVSTISRGLKAIAKELNVPVIALSQLSRETERRMGNKRPFLSDLRDSGSIEQDADVVAFIHRESYYNRDEEGQEDPSTRDTAEIIIAKQRNGPTGTVKLAYLPRITAFDNLEMRHWAHIGDDQAA
jgi:replicative DNA helicase